MNITRKFDTFDAILDYAEGPTDAYARSSRTVERNYRSRDAWYGTPTFEAAMRQARFGWPEGLEQIAPISNAVNEAVAQRAMTRQETFYATSGAVVDIGRYTGGEPECMMNFVEDVAVGRKILTIRVNVSASCCNEAHRLFNRGAAVIALVDLLEQNGFSCEIIAFDTTVWNGSFYTVEAPLKVCGYPIDRDRLAFGLCSPSFLRRVLFSVEEREPADVRRAFDIGGCYGSPGNRPTEFSSEETGINLGAMYGYGKDFTTQESAVEWALGQARRLLSVEAEVEAEA
jgi:hypothetical protein